MAEESALLKESRDGVLILTINRPNALNCFNMPLLETFQSTISEIAFDRTIKVVIITGSTEGKNSFSTGADLKERGFWDDYTTAFEDAITHTNRSYAPWIIVPANDKKVARAIVADAIATAIDNLDIDYPAVSREEKDKLQEAKRQLESE